MNDGRVGANGALVADSPGPGVPGGVPAHRPSLLEAIRAAAPEAFLVEPRLLRRLARHDPPGAEFAGSPGSPEACLIPAASALACLDRDEIGLAPGELPPAAPLLLVEPDSEASDAESLVKYWRLIFHLRVRRAVAGPVRTGRLDRPAILRRIDRIGQAAFDEARSVLHAEGLLADPRDRAAAYVAFATLYAELRHFAPAWLPHFFPSLGDPAAIDAIVAADVEVPALLAASRPAGAPPLPRAEEGAEDEEDEEPPPPDGPEPAPSAPLVGGASRWHRWLTARADRAAARGNMVRAAICRLRAARLVSARQEAQERIAAVRQLEDLAGRLAGPLELDEEGVLAWGRALPALLDRAARGIWSPEARLLYDLQKIAEEHGRTVYAVDLLPWMRSGGRVPIRRPLPDYADVLRVNHVRSARRRLARVHLDEAERDRLTLLLHEAEARAEAILRRRFRPKIVATLDGMGWTPRNPPEQVALDKLVEELLDRVIDRGFLAMGDLRDAVSRSDLKLPDLTGPRQFFRGDRLLRTDAALGDSLDGVYRRGEIYLRWLQRASSLAFGTAIGRLLTLYVILPFGGAFLLLEGLNHLVNPVIHWLSPPHQHRPHHRAHVHLFNPTSFVLLSLFLLGLVNHPGFRRWAARAASWLLWALGRVLVGPLRWLLSRSVVLAIARSAAFDRLFRWAIKPLIFGLAALAALALDGVGPRPALLAAGCVYLLSAVLINTRRGRDLEEIAVDRTGRAWQHLRYNLAPGLIRWVNEVFGRLLGWVERALYMLDEWRRFHAGQAPGLVPLKAVLGLLAFAVAYVVRFAANLVVEPQVNPIKHFPVVTVSHKIMAPMILAMPKFLTTTFGVGKWTANIAAGLLQFILPGIFGFLVWELKENWKLFEANRRRGLGPVIVGHHGETIVRLLRPGFHSGTLPKLYARLRRADRKPVRAGRRSPVRKYREAIRRVEHEVRHFVEREFLPLLAQGRPLEGLRFEAGPIALGTNRIAVDVLEAGHPGRPLGLAFEEQSGWLLASVEHPGWLDALDEPRRAAVRDALAGLYKRAGVDLVRQQLEAALPGDYPPYDIADEGIVVWPDDAYGAEVVYPLARGPALEPVVTVPPAPPAALRPLDANRLLLSRYLLTWSRWVELWQRDRRGEGHPEPAIPGMALLPDRHRLAPDDPAEAPA